MERRVRQKQSNKTIHGLTAKWCDRGTRLKKNNNNLDLTQTEVVLNDENVKLIKYQVKKQKNQRYRWLMQLMFWNELKSDYLRLFNKRSVNEKN